MKRASALTDKLRQMNVFSSVMEEIGEDNHEYAIATIHENEDFVDLIIHMNPMEITCNKNGIETTVEEIVSEHKTMAGVYGCVCRIAAHADAEKVYHRSSTPTAHE